MTDKNLIGKRLGQYEITGEIGKGGMAVVYKARQPSMDRDVAVKVIGSELTSNPEFISRFEHEARLIALLQHAHILPVYDFGREGDVIYLVMRLVDGGSMDSLLRTGGLPVPQVVRLLNQICSALNYAHNEGVVHRDLKPNNILLDKSGSPYLTDFGIAKLLTGQTALTATGTVMGTPSYMAPEQWKSEAIDARTDIYALGCMLYEMLTGQLPFVGETPFALMYKHFDQMPPEADKAVPGLPSSINNVIARAMAKDPADRFSSAEQMAEAFSAAVSGAPTPLAVPRSTLPLTDFQSTVLGEAAPTSAGTMKMPPAGTTKNPVGTVPQAAPAAPSRLPMVAGLVALLIVVAAVVLLSRPTSQTAQPTAQATTQNTAQALVPTAVQTEAAVPQPTEAATTAATVAGNNGVAGAAGAFALQQTLEGHTGWVNGIAWSPDGSQIASVSEDKTIRIWDVATGKESGILRGHTENIYSVVWSADGAKLATGSDDGTMRVWDVKKGQPLAAYTNSAPIGKPQLVDWSPDGKQLVIGQNDGNVLIWDLATEKVVKTLKTDGFWIPVAWSPNGKLIASVGKENGIQLWDAATGDSLGNYPAHAEFVSSLTWSRDSSRLASTSHDGTVKLWDVTTGKALPVLTINASPASGVSYAAWSPNGKLIASSAGFINLGGTDDKAIKIWDASSGTLIATLKGHENPIKMALWSPDGSKLASAGLDNVIKIWAGQ